MDALVVQFAVEYLKENTDAKKHINNTELDEAIQKKLGILSFASDEIRDAIKGNPKPTKAIREIVEKVKQ
jgi:hypothetical protein